MLFNHFDSKGQAIIVDVSAKHPTMRAATARSNVQMQPAALQLVVDGALVKGEVLGVARLAGIAAAKKTPDLIPLSHPLAIHAVGIKFSWNAEAGTIAVEATMRAFERTGVEMEAMVAASATNLITYDMCKDQDKGISITETLLLYKEGGKSGVYQRESAA